MFTVIVFVVPHIFHGAPLELLSMRHGAYVVLPKLRQLAPVQGPSVCSFDGIFCIMMNFALLHGYRVISSFHCNV